MYAVFGKSLSKEEQRKDKAASKSSPSDRYYSNNNAYQISPNYYDIARCHEFIDLAKKTHDVRCIYIARAEKVTIGGRPKLSKKTGKPLSRFVRLTGI
ncbi:hypothetical protein [Snodgrassella communis]|jgi:hypothetical protein|uniref:hypothetical protein n=1 Tax=Snodgrassella communis TaxID=2946699 RepID=UPI000C1F2E24|nr:hypothetical protein [Snodgrassella communis]PIT22075.1 hypothetical protein BGI35_05535 [Snodgrassella communis]